MTLAEALDIVFAAYHEDDAEREAIVAALVPILIDDKSLAHLIDLRWFQHADQIREAITAYQVERAEIDATAAEDALHHD